MFLTPIPSDGPYLWDLVLADLAVRDEHGELRYGPMIGGDELDRQYEEAVNTVFALRKQIFDRDGK